MSLLNIFFSLKEQDIIIYKIFMSDVLAIYITKFKNIYDNNNKKHHHHCTVGIIFKIFNHSQIVISIWTNFKPLKIYITRHIKIMVYLYYILVIFNPLRRCCKLKCVLIKRTQNISHNMVLGYMVHNIIVKTVSFLLNYFKLFGWNYHPKDIVSTIEFTQIIWRAKL